jgi:hypothetical protein
MVAAAARSVGMMATDDETQRRRHSRPPDLLRYNEQYEGSSTQQQRSKGGKVTTNEIRRNVVRRVDVGAEIVCMKLACSQMTRGEWESFIGLKEGILFDPPPPLIVSELPKGQWYRVSVPRTRTWHAVPPPARSATIEQVARHYLYTEGSVARMEREARRLLNTLRERAGLTRDIPDVPIWPAIMSDESLLRMLYGKE